MIKEELIEQAITDAEDIRIELMSCKMPIIETNELLDLLIHINREYGDKRMTDEDKTSKMLRNGSNNAYKKEDEGMSEELDYLNNLYEATDEACYDATNPEEQERLINELRLLNNIIKQLKVETMKLEDKIQKAIQECNNSIDYYNQKINLNKDNPRQKLLLRTLQVDKRVEQEKVNLLRRLLK